MSHLPADIHRRLETDLYTYADQTGDYAAAAQLTAAAPLPSPGKQVTLDLSRWMANSPDAPVHPRAAAAPDKPLTYSSTQATNCAGCGKHKHTPLRIDAMGGYVCLTCIDQKLGSLLGEFGYPEPPQILAFWQAAADAGKALARTGSSEDARAFCDAVDRLTTAVVHPEEAAHAQQPAAGAQS